MGPTHVAQNTSIDTPWSQQFGKHRNQPPSSSVWPLGCGPGSLEGYPAAFPLGIVSTCCATPPFPCNCTGNLVICLHLVPQDKMGLGVLLAAVLHNTVQILHHSSPTSHPKPRSLPAPATSMSASEDCQKRGMLSSDPGPHSQLRGPSPREGPTRWQGGARPVPRSPDSSCHPVTPSAQSSLTPGLLGSSPLPTSPATHMHTHTNTHSSF